MSIPPFLRPIISCVLRSFVKSIKEGYQCCCDKEVPERPKDKSHLSSRYCWRTYFKVLGVLFLGEVSQLFCLQRRHVGHTTFGTGGFANSIPPLNETLKARRHRHSLGEWSGWCFHADCPQIGGGV